MTPGKFFRYGLQIELVVNEQDVDYVTEVLRSLRPVFVEGKALKEQKQLDFKTLFCEKVKAGFKPLPNLICDPNTVKDNVNCDSIQKNL
jgi:hypothetical protein